MNRSMPHAGLPRLENLESRRLMAATLDSTFSGDGKTTLDINNRDDAFKDVVMQIDGKIVAGGKSRFFNPTNGQSYYKVVLARYKTNGDLDPTFGSGGKVALSSQSLHPFALKGRAEIESVALQPDGKIVAAGVITILQKHFPLLMRFNANGSLDSTFSGDGIWLSGKAHHVDFREVAVANDGKIVAAGWAHPNALITRFNPNGTLDSTFHGDGQMEFNIGNFTTVASGIAIAEGGAITVTGAVLDNPGPTKYMDVLAARIGVNGQLDSSFAGGGATRIGFNGTGEAAESIALLPNGRILIGGDVQGTAALWRLNANGTPDSTFGTGGRALGTTGGFSDMLLQKTGRIVVLEQKGMTVRRYHANGASDGSLYASMGGDMRFSGGLASLPWSDKIAVASATEASNNQYDGAVMRLNGGSVPETPVGVTVTGHSQSSIRVAWIDIAVNEQLYQIQRSSNPAFTVSWSKSVSAATKSVIFDNLAPNSGWYFRVRAVNDTGNSPWSPVKYAQVQPTYFSTVRINSGGSAITTQGNVFEADNKYLSGDAVSDIYAVGNTFDDALYYSYRKGYNFGYQIPVVNGNYILKLHFAEPSATAIGQRKFNVFAENYQIMNGFDIFAAAGLQNAYSQGFQVFVADGYLSLNFVAQSGEALVSAIEVIPLYSPPPPPSPNRVTAVIQKPDAGVIERRSSDDTETLQRSSGLTSPALYRK